MLILLLRHRIPFNIVYCTAIFDTDPKLLRGRALPRKNGEQEEENRYLKPTFTSVGTKYLSKNKVHKLLSELVGFVGSI